MESRNEVSAMVPRLNIEFNTDRPKEGYGHGVLLERRQPGGCAERSRRVAPVQYEDGRVVLVCGGTRSGCAGADLDATGPSGESGSAVGTTAGSGSAAATAAATSAGPADERKAKVRRILGDGDGGA